MPPLKVQNGGIEVFLQHLDKSRIASLEKAMAPHSSTLAWKIPWTEEPGRLQSMGSLGEAAQGAPTDPCRDSRGERSPWLLLETRPDSPGDDEDLREPLVRRQGSQVSMRVARGSASWLSSHGRGLGPRDALKKDASSAKTRGFHTQLDEGPETP